ncbi:replication protein A 70 kDa DNA-binding subunit A [Fagus crenata]
MREFAPLGTIRSFVWEKRSARRFSKQSRSQKSQSQSFQGTMLLVNGAYVSLPKWWKLVKIVVSEVLLELKKNYMVVTDNLVGNIITNGVRIVGIHGKFSVHFDCYFLPDVRETSQQHNGLLNLQTPHNAISALNLDQGRWAIKARVTAKWDIRCYSNARGDGKVFSFHLLDSDGGEIRVTCFNAVVDRFYDAIEVGKVYLISKGSLKPAKKKFNHLNNELEIILEATSAVELCPDEDGSIFSFRPISEIENAEKNSILDIIGIVISVNPSEPFMRKNGTETQIRILNLKDESGKSVELTLWGEFCNREGQQLQEMIDSGVFPVLAVKDGKINDYNGKSIGSFSATQLFINPDFPEARGLRNWFDRGGKNVASVSISRRC